MTSRQISTVHPTVQKRQPSYLYVPYTIANMNGRVSTLVACWMGILLICVQASPSQPKSVEPEYDCKALGQKFGKTLDEYTKLGRVAWSPRYRTCVAESLNIVGGTEMYAITAIPSGRSIGVSGGVTSQLDLKRQEETMTRDSLWNAAVAVPKKP